MERWVEGGAREESAARWSELTHLFPPLGVRHARAPGAPLRDA